MVHTRLRQFHYLAFHWASLGSLPRWSTHIKLVCMLTFNPLILNQARCEAMPVRDTLIHIMHTWNPTTPSLPPLTNHAHNLMWQSHNWVGSVSTMNFSKDPNHWGPMSTQETIESCVSRNEPHRRPPLSVLFGDVSQIGFVYTGFRCNGLACC